MPKVKKLFFTSKAEVFDFLKIHYPIKNKDLYLKFPNKPKSSLRNYKVMYRKLNMMDGLPVASIKMLLDIMTNKMTPMTHLSRKELDCIDLIGKWLSERLS